VLNNCIGYVWVIAFKSQCALFVAHSPDNSFMGFVVEQHFNFSTFSGTKKKQAVVYGKVENMWNVSSPMCSIAVVQLLFCMFQDRWVLNLEYICLVAVVITCVI
jgi:Glycosyltransferase family 18